MKHVGPDDIEMRCPGTLHAILRSTDLIEIKCHHIACTQGRRVTVYHYFNPDDGKLVDTFVYQHPKRRKQ